MARSYFGGLYTAEKLGPVGARKKATSRLGAIIFAMPGHDRRWREAHADAIDDIIDWWEDGCEPADRPVVLGRPVDGMFAGHLDGMTEKMVAMPAGLVPSLPAMDLEAGHREFEHYMSGRAGRSSDWSADPTPPGCRLDPDDIR